MRILFAGGPEFALPTLELLSRQWEIGAVLTTPDRAAGRGGQSRQSAVAMSAMHLNLPLLQPKRLDSRTRETVSALNVDLLVCVAFGMLFGPKFMSLFARGGINLHPSLLPRYRGPAPIQAAILAGDAEIGISVQWLAPRMDAGDILAQRSFPLRGNETTTELSQFCAAEGATMVAATVVDIAVGAQHSTPQNERLASYCELISKEHGHIDWCVPAVQIERMMRAYSPWPGCYTYLDDSRLILLCCTLYANEAGDDVGSAETGSVETGSTGAGSDYPPGSVVAIDNRYGILVQTGAGMIAITRLQMAGKIALDWHDFIHGYGEMVGKQLQ